MDASFPNMEKREKEDQRRLFDSPYYKVYAAEEDGKIVGFLAAWEFVDVRFIEHLAVDESCRGTGIGRQFLQEYMRKNLLPVVLEVEPPENNIARRRIGFYQRLDFFLNGFPYVQPPLRAGNPLLPLQIMSYPRPLSEEEFLPYKREIYRHAYGIEE